MTSEPGRPSSTMSALQAAAMALQLPDPVPPAENLRRLDGEGLVAWFEIAAAASRALLEAADLASEAVAMVRAAWSNPSPSARLGQLCDAAIDSAEITARQVQAADDLRSALVSVRFGTEGAIETAEAAVAALGVPVGDDLVAWAAQHGQAAVLEAIVMDLLGQLDALRNRAGAALDEAAGQLQADPRDPLQNLPVAQPEIGQADPDGGLLGTGRGAADVPIDAANRTLLERDLLSAEEPVRLMAEGVSTALARASASSGAARLVIYERPGATAQGRAAISVGDLGAADNVAVIVPGVGSSPRAMAELVPAAAALRDSTLRHAPRETAAAVIWAGYDAPCSWVSGVPVSAGEVVENTIEGLDDTTAVAGGAALAADLSLLRGLVAPSARISGFGFSMGSTTVSAAAHDGGRLDGLMLLASPGASRAVDDVDDLGGVPAQRTYAVAFDQDPVPSALIDAGATLGAMAVRPSPLTLAALLGGPGPFGPDPTSPDFGAQVVEADSNAPAIAPDYFDQLVKLRPDPSEIAEGLQHHSLDNYLAGESGDAAGALAAGRYSEIEVMRRD